MIRVGFIDYYLDQWHANNYPQLLSDCSGGEIKVCSAYAKIDSPIGGLTSKQWSEKYGIPLADSIEQVIADSDVLIVMSPNNPEHHPELCRLALQSGKPTYIDKTFATDANTARQIFAVAEKHGTPCYSSSALRFATELCDIDKTAIDRIYCEGPGFYDTYSIHQIEMIVALMGSAPKRVMFTGNDIHPSMIIEFCDGRFAQMYQRRDPEYSFRISCVDKESIAQIRYIESDFFSLFCESLAEFFETGKAPVSHDETVSVIGIREAGLRAAKNPFTWENI